MDFTEANNIVVKKEPSENSNGNCEDTPTQENTTVSEASQCHISGPLRYVSRRGRPPGGGYSIKPHAHYISFSNAPLSSSDSVGRQISNGSNSSLSPQELLKSGATSSTDSLDIRRFGFSGFEQDKNSFRCDGCDVNFSSRDTYAMHMLLRAKNESCVALPTSAISSNPENPTPREKFERELRQQTMLTALRNQAAVMSKAANVVLGKSSLLPDSLNSIAQSGTVSGDTSGLPSRCGSEGPFSFNNLFSLDAYGLYVDPRHYRRVLEEYGLRIPSSKKVEQLSCRECGEIFTSKDALAMHMMFHTRDDEKDVSSNSVWGDIRSNSSQRQSSSLSSASSSPTHYIGSKKTTKTSESGTAIKRETTKAEERELTAERVAELKMMAIESSWRSSLKKATTSKQSTRPHSVSHVTPVSNPAQDRPLSADDVRRFTATEQQGDQDMAQTLVFSNNSEIPSNKSLSQKRRHLSLEQDTLDVKRLFTDSSTSKRNKYENIFYNLFCRTNKKLDASQNLETRKDYQLRNQHLLPSSAGEVSASNPESCTDIGGSATDVTKSRPFPYLDAIMSQEAVLVPLDPTTSSKGNNNTTAEAEKSFTDDNHKTQASAIDFSVGRREYQETINRSNWYIPENSQNNQIKSAVSNFLPGTSVNGNRSDNARNNCIQFENLDYDTISKINRIDARGVTISRQRVSTGIYHQENEGPSRNSLSESTSRVGEARYCPHCEILFLDVTLFHLHMGLHNVNNPWQCNTCGLVCSGRLDFNTHVLHY